MRQFSSPQSIRHQVGFIPFWIVIRHGSKRTVRWWIVAPYSRTTCAAQWLLLYRRFQLDPQIYSKITMSLKAYCCALTFCLKQRVTYVYKYYYCTIHSFINIFYLNSYLLDNRGRGSVQRYYFQGRLEQWRADQVQNGFLETRLNRAVVAAVGRQNWTRRAWRKKNL